MPRVRVCRAARRCPSESLVPGRGRGRGAAGWFPCRSPQRRRRRGASSGHRRRSRRAPRSDSGERRLGGGGLRRQTSTAPDQTHTAALTKQAHSYGSLRQPATLPLPRHKQPRHRDPDAPARTRVSPCVAGHLLFATSAHAAPPIDRSDRSPGVLAARAKVVSTRGGHDCLDAGAAAGMKRQRARRSSSSLC